MLGIAVAETVALMLVGGASFRAAASLISFAGQEYRVKREGDRRASRVRQRVEDILSAEQAASPLPGQEMSWRGLRKFQIVKRQYETADGSICSFYLAPFDGKPIPPFHPGQFLTFDLPGALQGERVVRTYSLSSCPAERHYYRVTVKRIEGRAGAPGGIGSSYFHDHLKVGDLVDVRSPSGQFALRQTSERPIVMVAGGVGLTPLLSMLRWLVATRSQREVWFFYGTRNRMCHAMYEEVSALCAALPNVMNVVAYSRPTAACVKNADYHVKGHLTANLLRPVVQARPCDVYLCGPAAMMETLSRELISLGVPADDIRSEGFGGALVANAPDTSADPAAGAGVSFRVRFLRSGRSAIWTPRSGSLLDLAEAHGVKARCSCRQGICGTCAVTLSEGSIGYVRPPVNEPAQGMCLPCIARPDADIAINL